MREFQNGFYLYTAPKRGGFFWPEQKPRSIFRVRTILEGGNYILQA